MRRLLPTPQTVLPDEAITAAYSLEPDVPWVRVSLVTTLDGSTRGPDGTSMSLSTAPDRRLFSTLRMASDVVLVGAGSVRAGYYRPSQLPIAVVSRRLDLSPDLPLFAEATPASPRTIVYTTDDSLAAAPDWLLAAADVMACGAGEVDVVAVLADLGYRGLPRVHCEGGPMLASALAAADVVDEFLVTLAPMLVGAPASEHLLAIPGGLIDTHAWTFRQVLDEEGTVFVQLVRRS